MANAEHLEIVRQGAKAIGAWREANPDVDLDLRRASLLDTNLSGANLVRADLSGANLEKVDFSGANLRSADLSGADLRGAKLIRANLGGASCSRADLGEADLRGAYLSRANLRGANLIGAHLGGAGFYMADLGEAELNGAHLRWADLRGANLIRANLGRAGFFMVALGEANLSGAYLNGSALREADLLAAGANESTSVTGARVHSVAVDRYTPIDPHDARAMRQRAGQRARSQDGVATLRRWYSGIWPWVHGMGLAVFLFPYLWFVGVHWAQLEQGPGLERARETAKAAQDEVRRLEGEVERLRTRLGTRLGGAPIAAAPRSAPDDRAATQKRLSIRRALWNFIRSGGADVRGGSIAPLAFAAFWFLLTYNLLHGLLLWKTRSLELRRQVRRLQETNPLSGFWGGLYRATRWGLTANVAILALLVWHFLGHEIAS